MAFDSVPWFVGGGAVHSAISARNVSYAAMGGAEGILEVGDLKVSQFAAPGAGVRIAMGGIAIKNAYAGGSQQMYAGRNTADVNMIVAATGGAGRSDMVVVRIDDPQYGGQIPADRTIGPYIMGQVISNVNPAFTKASQLGLNYPAVALARLDIPANTASITDAMIHDVRKVARPRRQSYLNVAKQSGTFGESGFVLLDTPAYKTMSRSAAVEVPEWATVARVVVTVSGLFLMYGSAAGSMQVIVGYGGPAGNDTLYNQQQGAQEINQRASYTMAADVPISADRRGTVQYMYAQGSRTSGPGYLRADDGTTFVFQIEFLEVAE